MTWKPLTAAIVMLAVCTVLSCHKEQCPPVQWEVPFSESGRIGNIAKAVRGAVIALPNAPQVYEAGASQTIDISMSSLRRADVLKGADLQIERDQLAIIKGESKITIEWRWCGKSCQVRRLGDVVRLEFINANSRGGWGTYPFHLYSEKGVVWLSYLNPDPTVLSVGGEDALTIPLRGRSVCADQSILADWNRGVPDQATY